MNLSDEDIKKNFFLKIAELESNQSEDSTKIGAVIVSADGVLLSFGHNDFTDGIDQSDKSRWEKPLKYSYIEHAERNAIYKAAKDGLPLKGSTLYLAGFGSPTVPCTECAKAVIQSGIVRVIGVALENTPAHWQKDLDFALDLLLEANITLEQGAYTHSSQYMTLGAITK